MSRATSVRCWPWSLYFCGRRAGDDRGAPGCAERSRRRARATGAADRRRDAADRGRSACCSGTGSKTVRSPAVVAATLALGGVGLIVAERLGSAVAGFERRSATARRSRSASRRRAALVPGVSRSGATLTLALLLGLRRAQAARFVFLLSLPAVLAAAAREALKLREVGVAAIPVTLVRRGTCWCRRSLAI